MEATSTVQVFTHQVASSLSGKLKNMEQALLSTEMDTEVHYNYYLCDTDNSLLLKVLSGTEFDTKVHITPTPAIRTPLSVLRPYVWFVSMLRWVNYVSIIKNVHVSVLCLAMLSLKH